MSEVDTVQTKLVKPCEMCGKIVDHTLHSHHAIPRYMENSGDEDIVQVCLSCHKKADWIYDHFLLKSVDQLFKTLRPTPHKYKWARLILDPHNHGRGTFWVDVEKQLAFRKYYHHKVEYERLLFNRTFYCARWHVIVRVNYNKSTGTVLVYDYITKSNNKPHKRAFKSLYNSTPEFGVTFCVDYIRIDEHEYIRPAWRYRHPKTTGDRALMYTQKRLGKFNKRSAWRKK